MKFIEYSEKLDAIKYMAKRHRTGSPCQLASRLNVSPRTIRRMIQQLKVQGYQIAYDRFRNSYVISEQEEKTCH